MINNKRISVLAMLGLLSMAGCGDSFLRGGALTESPNTPPAATKNQRFQGVQVNIWTLLGSDIPRETGILAQQFFGRQSQYFSLQTAYTVDPNTTNGAHSGLYGGGGLVDIVALKDASIASGDTIFLGIAQVQEGLLMGTGADLFGDLVYSQALTGMPNPKLDDQFAVYDSVQKVLSAAIVNLATTPSVTNVGPGAADRVYGGSPAKWTALAHTLKARFYIHTAEVKGTPAYQAALAEAKLGIMSNAGNYFGAFTSSTNEKNFYYQFNVEAGRSGYVIPNPSFHKLLQTRMDPRDSLYFAISKGVATNLSATRLAEGYPQPFVTYDENTLIWAEAAYRTGDYVTALAKLNEERKNNGLPAEAVVGSDPKVVTGGSLLNEILLEEYTSDFQLGSESFNLYKRTCTPNLVPTVKGQKIPRRLFYDTSEQQTDTNIPEAGVGVNGFANRNDPANATSDGTGAACLGQ